MTCSTGVRHCQVGQVSWCCPKYDHVTQLLMDLHWLRVPQRIQYKLCVLVHGCLKGCSSKIIHTYLDGSQVFITSHSVNFYLLSLDSVEGFIPSQLCNIKLSKICNWKICMLLLLHPAEMSNCQLATFQRKKCCYPSGYVHFTATALTHGDLGPWKSRMVTQMLREYVLVDREWQ